MILNDLTAAPHHDPSDLLRLRDSIYAADLFFAALVHLNFFTWLSKNPSNAENICKELNIKPRPADVMLTLFKAMNLIEEEAGVYRITPLAEEHLTEKSAWNLGPYFASLRERPIVQKMLEVLATGKPAGWGGIKNEREWAAAMERDNFAEQFTSGMDSRGAFLAPGLARSFDFAKYRSVLDIAGGSGIYAASIKARYPTIEAAVLEKPPVDRIAKNALKKRGVAEQVNVFSGDMFKDDIPRGFDVHLYSHVLHDWDLEENKVLVQNSYKSLNVGGIIMIHGAHLNREKIGPLSVAEYSVFLLFSTQGKCYSLGEMEELLTEVGFKNIYYQTTVGNRSIVIGRKE